MWYSGDDASTSRIVRAECAAGGSWERIGVAVDAGFSGCTDAYGAACPAVVRTPAGYLMAYAGSDGADTRLHMATSADGDVWKPHATFIQRGEADAVARHTPAWSSVTSGGCSTRVSTGQRTVAGPASWRRCRRTGRRGIESARSWNPNPASWRCGSRPSSCPHGRFHMFHVSDDDARTCIALATSADGVTWERRGTTLTSPL